MKQHPVIAICILLFIGAIAVLGSWLASPIYNNPRPKPAFQPFSAPIGRPEEHAAFHTKDANTLQTCFVVLQMGSVAQGEVGKLYLWDWPNKSDTFTGFCQVISL